MKILILFLCIFAASVLQSLLKMNGITLGSIPTTLLYGAALWLAKTLTLAWKTIQYKKQKLINPYEIDPYADEDYDLNYTGEDDEEEIAE